MHVGVDLMNVAGIRELRISLSNVDPTRLGRHTISLRPVRVQHLAIHSYDQYVMHAFGRVLPRTCHTDDRFSLRSSRCCLGSMLSAERRSGRANRMLPSFSLGKYVSSPLITLRLTTSCLRGRAIYAAEAIYAWGLPPPGRLFIHEYHTAEGSGVSLTHY